jgi:hypothetical protein
LSFFPLVSTTICRCERKKTENRTLEFIFYEVPFTNKIFPCQFQFSNRLFVLPRIIIIIVNILFTGGGGGGGGGGGRRDGVGSGDR